MQNVINFPNQKRRKTRRHTNTTEGVQTPIDLKPNGDWLNEPIDLNFLLTKGVHGCLLIRAAGESANGVADGDWVLTDASRMPRVGNLLLYKNVDGTGSIERFEGLMVARGIRREVVGVVTHVIHPTEAMELAA